MPYSVPHFSIFLARLDAKMPDSGRPLAPRWIPNGTQNRPSGAKKAQVSQRRSCFLADLLPWSLSDRSWAPVWLILEGLWMDFEGFLGLFVAKLVIFWRMNFEWIVKTWPSAITARNRHKTKQNNQHKTNKSPDYPGSQFPNCSNITPTNIQNDKVLNVNMVKLH